MRKLLIALAALAVLIAVIVVAVFTLTGGVTRSGDRFLALVRDGKTHEAYLATAKAFRTATPEAGFASFLKGSGLADNQRAEWGSRSISGSTGELEGSIRTRSGDTVPLKLKLVREEGEWRVIAIEPLAAGIVTSTSAGAPPAAATPLVPTEAELQAMARSAVLDLGRAVATKDFTAFHGSTAALWQRQATPETLRAAFQDLIDKGADLSVVQGQTATLTGKRSIDDSGRLILEGFFPTEPTRVGFTLKYIQEAAAWKLVGINVQLEPTRSAAASPGVVPSEAELTALADSSMKLFAAAVANDDFSEIHSTIAQAWKRQMPLEEMSRAFHSLVEKKTLLGAVDAGQPVFSEKADIDSDGLLALVGHYPGKPRVRFTLHYLNEDAQWRLAGVNVSVKEE